MEMNELDLYCMDLNTPYRLTFAPRDDDAPGTSPRYIVLYRDEAHPDQVLVIGASGGTVGILYNHLPAPIIGIADALFFSWLDLYRQGWYVYGMCVSIKQEDADPGRAFPQPLQRQLASIGLPHL
jgi:hypothetical protein